MSVKAFNLNFSEVLTKREENHRDTAPLMETIYSELHFVLDQLKT